MGEGFSEAHRTLRASLARFAAERLAPAAEAGEADPPLSLEPLAGAAELGCLAAAAPAAVDGGADPAAGLVVAEELGRAAPLGAAATVLDAAWGAAWLLAHADGGRHREFAAAALHAGRRLPLVDAPGLDAVPADGGWRLHGRAAGVLDAARSGPLAVVASAGDRGVVALLDPGEAGVAVTPEPPGLGWRCAAPATVTLTGAAVPAGAAADLDPARVGERRELAAVHRAAAAIAGAEIELARARGYGEQREAFGRAVGRFQVNRHRLAGLGARLTAARELVRDAVLLADPARRHAAVLAAARHAPRAVDGCLQLHGGAGYAEELPVARAWRDQHTLAAADAGDARRDAVAARWGGRAC